MKEHRNLKPGPIRHEQLSPDLLSRIENVSVTLANVLPMTKEEWIDGLKRDQDPDSEVVWWERVSKFYEDFTIARILSPVEKQAAFNVIFGLMSGLDSKGMEATLSKLDESLVSVLMASMTITLKILGPDSGEPTVH